MLFDVLFDRLVNSLKDSRKQSYGERPLITYQEEREMPRNKRVLVGDEWSTRAGQQARSNKRARTSPSEVNGRLKRSRSGNTKATDDERMSEDDEDDEDEDMEVGGHPNENQKEEFEDEHYDDNPKRHKHGFFTGARNFVLHDPKFTTKKRYQTIQILAAGNSGFDPILERIATYADLDATMDSSARYPPPLCHPGTRLKIGDKLFNWLLSPINCEWDMQWLHGPAGTGKSAVAQTFAERCDKNGRLGASFFFSRLYGRNNPNTVIPSLVYQLAVRNPEYKSLVAAHLVNDPELLRRKTRRTQFTKLIVEPFSHLQTQGHQSVQESLLVILDGLDECEGETAQREIIEMISEVVRLKKNFPLVWLICSRPEAHLKYVFSRADFTVNCGREELAIDAESIADVDFYLRDGLVGIKAEYQDVVIPMWPPEEQVSSLSRKASGHFGFASVSLRYIGDPIVAAPMTQLNALLSSLSGVRLGADNPLRALDALYNGILGDVPDEILSTVQQILGYKLYGPSLYPRSAQEVCSFLHVDQTRFYNAFRKLHSVVNVPTAEAASKKGLEFYHLSFSDYLRDRSRSGKFAIEEQSALLQHSKSYLSWYEIDLKHFHTTDGPEFNKLHRHGVLPGMKWTSDDNMEAVSRSLAKEVALLCWAICADAVEWDDVLLLQIRNFDFRYIQTDELLGDWRDFVNKLWKHSSDGFIRTEPQSEADFRLLEYMESLIKSWWSSQPATFPLGPRQDGHGGEYFLLGHDAKAVVCWTTGFKPPNSYLGMLNCDKAPSKKRISDYQTWLAEKGAVKAVVAERGWTGR